MTTKYTGDAQWDMIFWTRESPRCSKASMLSKNFKRTSSLQKNYLDRFIMYVVPISQECFRKGRGIEHLFLEHFF